MHDSWQSLSGRNGVPLIFQIAFGLKRPTAMRHGLPGVDVAGEVEAAGRNVARFKPGDAVFGVCIDDPHASGTKNLEPSTGRPKLPVVCSTRNVDMVRSIGADHVIGYNQEDFSGRAERYDLLFDCVGNHSLAECGRVLNPNGSWVMVGDLSGRSAVGIVVRLIAG